LPAYRSITRQNLHQFLGEELKAVDPTEAEAGGYSSGKHGRSTGHRDMDGAVAKWLTPFGTTSKGNGN